MGHLCSAIAPPCRVCGARTGTTQVAHISYPTLHLVYLVHLVSDTTQVAYILLCGYMPFDETHGASCNWVTDYPAADWDLISPEARNFCERCLQVR